MTAQHSPTGGDDAMIRCGVTRSTPGREPLRIMLLGSPRVVDLTTHQLHVLRFAEATAWSTHLKLPDHDLIVEPNEGEVLSILVRYLPIEQR